MNTINRSKIFGLFLTMFLGMVFHASALKVTFEWDIPGSVKIQLESQVGPYVDLAPDQTSYVLETKGWCYLYGEDGYIITSAQTADGEKSLNIGRNNNGTYAGAYFADSYDGLTYKVKVAKGL